MFTIGCDPELFLVDKGKGVSAHGLIRGTKESPHPTSHGAIQVDGLALEFNTLPTPAADFQRFNLNIVKTISDLKTEVREAGFKGSFAITPTMDFDPDYMEAQPDEAKMLGCDPDWNAYTMALNDTPNGDVNFRGAGGHIHIGWGADIPVDNQEHLEICAKFVRTLDCTVGMFMTFIDRDPRRRQMYGKAGAFRPKPYGVEYRTPSNEWIKTVSRRKVIHNLVNYAIGKQRQGGYAPESEIRRAEIINTGDFKAARQILGEMGTDQRALNKVFNEKAFEGDN